MPRSLLGEVLRTPGCPLQTSARNVKPAACLFGVLAGAMPFWSARVVFRIIASSEMRPNSRETDHAPTHDLHDKRMESVLIEGRAQGVQILQIGRPRFAKRDKY